MGDGGLGRMIRRMNKEDMEGWIEGKMGRGMEGVMDG